jgi:hypothetical protein
MTTTEKKELPLEARVIQCINFFAAPKTTQDAVDQLSAEFLTANLLRTYAEKRYEAAKRSVNTAHEDKINDVRGRATESMQKSTTMLYGSDWVLNLSANRPSLRTDVDELRTELVRLGISVDLIDEAISKVTKKSTPALVISVTPTAE